jgi:hypothetical protein
VEVPSSSRETLWGCTIVSNHAPSVGVGPHLRTGSFTLERLLSHIDPGAAAGSEEFVEAEWGSGSCHDANS